MIRCLNCFAEITGGQPVTFRVSDTERHRAFFCCRGCAKRFILNNTHRLSAQTLSLFWADYGAVTPKPDPASLVEFGGTLSREEYASFSQDSIWAPSYVGSLRPQGFHLVVPQSDAEGDDDVVIVGPEGEEEDEEALD
jgi:hypothetical protein